MFRSQNLVYRAYEPETDCEAIRQRYNNVQTGANVQMMMAPLAPKPRSKTDMEWLNTFYAEAPLA